MTRSRITAQTAAVHNPRNEHVLVTQVKKYGFAILGLLLVVVAFFGLYAMATSHSMVNTAIAFGATLGACLSFSAARRSGW